jgi:uncharacterized protein
MTRNRFILCCDGGGVRSRAIVRFLYLVEQHAELSIAKSFDLFAGTSAGSYIAAALAVNGYSANQLYRFCSKEQCQRLMQKSCWDRLFNLVQFWPKYDGLEKTLFLQEIFPPSKDNTPVENVITTMEAMEQDHKPLVVTVYNVSQGRPWLWTNCNSSPSEAEERFSQECPLWKALDCSSAAPTYFPAIQVGQEYFVDGGMTTNDPTLVAYGVARRLWPHDNIAVVSIGTGQSLLPSPGRECLQWGGIQWLINGRLIDIALDDKSTETLARQLLSDYTRIQSPLSVDGLFSVSSDLDDDSPENLAELDKMGDYWFKQWGEELIVRLYGK